MGWGTWAVTFDELKRSLLASSGRRQDVSITVDADALTVGLDFAIPLGLLVTELVSNALKHAFTGGDGGDIRVLLRQCPDATLLLAVSDNGHGNAVRTETPGWRGGLGMTIVEALTDQLEGEITMFAPNEPESVGVGTNGSCVEVRMPLPGVALL
jgi:two-component sensor histidine kinase